MYQEKPAKIEVLESIVEFIDEELQKLMLRPPSERNDSLGSHYWHERKDIKERIEKLTNTTSK
jgi:hypothetical protein